MQLKHKEEWKSEFINSSNLQQTEVKVTSVITGGLPSTKWRIGSLVGLETDLNDSKQTFAPERNRSSLSSYSTILLGLFAAE